MKKTTAIITLILTISVIIIFNIIEESHQNPIKTIKEEEILVINPELKNNSIEITTEKKEEDSTNSIPKKKINFVPFTSQAPYAKWDHLHDEACEEASLIMAHNYLKKSNKIEMRYAEDEIQSMVTFQKTSLGSHRDLNVEEITKLAKDFYQEEYQIINLKSNQNEGDNLNKNQKEDLNFIKKELSNENIFIIPAAGRTLQNPYFKEPGPLYHALVLIGYDDNKQEFITHDPGTRRGKNFRYSYEIILNAIHDFPGKKENILEGQKNIILIKKQ